MKKPLNEWLLIYIPPLPAVGVFTNWFKHNLYGGPYGGKQNYFVNLRNGLNQSTYDQIITYFLGKSSVYTDSMNLSEWHIYGSSRIGIYQTSINMAYRNVRIVNGVTTQETSTTVAWPSYTLFDIQRGAKRYELTNHLGNVLAVVTDKKIQVCTSTAISYYTADLVSATDYSPFGAPLAGRTYTAANISYRFGFNGQEKDDEVSGAGNSYTAEFWQYDSRLGRRFNRDPKPNHAISEYVCFANNPIFFKDQKGDTIRTSLFGPEVGWSTKVKAAGDYKKRYDDGVFVFTLHGSENGVQIGYPKLTKEDGTRDGQGGDEKGRNQQYFEDNIPDIYKEFAAACPEFKNALEKGKKITIILQSCNTGTGDNPIAQKIADYNANVTVVAPNGYVSAWDNYVRTYDDPKEKDENGNFKRSSGTGFYSIFRKDKDVEQIKKPINLN